MRTTLKRGIGRVAVGNGHGQAALPPGVLSPVTRYHQPERKRSLLRRVGMILFVLVALSLAAVSGLAGGTYLWELESLNRTAPVEFFKEASEGLGVERPGRPSIALVIGYDHRPEDGTAASRSDTLMLLRTDPTNDTISMLSFPRDLIVPIRCPDGRTATDRINSAYFYCAPNSPGGALETVRQLTGLPIHFLIGVNFDGFRESVDKLGGVWLDIDRRYVNLQGGDYATINLWPGYQRLKGWQALDFVRYRHTDSDLFRLGRQQQFVKAMKQVVRHKFKDPRNVFEVVNAMTRNMQIGRAGGRGISPSTLHKYARFAYEMPAGNFFQVKIAGLTGTNELTTATSNIDEAIAEFVHPDVEAPGKATDQVLPGQRRRKTKAAPSPKDVSLVVLNGNGQPGAAANTSYLLAQKGYRVGQPPEGFQANAPRRVFRTQIYYQGKAKAQLAAQAVSGLFNSTDVKRLPRNLELRTLANGAMITVIVGQTFSGKLTPTPVDRTPPKQPPYVRNAKSEVLPAVRRAAAWKVGFPLQIPTIIERSSILDTEVPYRVYKIDDDAKTVRFTFRTDENEYWGIQETNWEDAPALEDKNFSAVIKRRQYDLYYSGPNLHMVVLRAGGATYWVVNTLLDSLSNETMLAIAKGLRPMSK